jgi:hypothetical protein
MDNMPLSIQYNILLSSLAYDIIMQQSRTVSAPRAGISELDI